MGKTRISQPKEAEVSSGISCALISDQEGFLKLESEYRDLYSRSSATSPFLSWEWISTWWEVFGENNLFLAVFTFREGTRLVGCAPLVIRHMARLPFLRRLEPMGIGRSDYMDFLFEDGVGESGTEAFLEFLRQQRFWDVLDLHQLPETSPVAVYFRSNQNATHCKTRRHDICPQAVLPQTWEEYTRSLSKKHRGNITYYRKIIERDFDCSLTTISEDDLARSLDDLIRLHQLRWKKLHMPGAFYSSKVRRFHHLVAPKLLKANLLKLYRLELNGQAAALLYCLSSPTTSHYYIGGFDPAFSKYSVGTVLIAHAIEDSIRDGKHMFDFLRGTEPYKYRWNVREHTNFRVEMRRGGWRSHTITGWNQALRILEWQVKEVAERISK
jgi:CelD/BcsL family acetyltransferase involved in cellulose biosynthesis